MKNSACELHAQVIRKDREPAKIPRSTPWRSTCAATRACTPIVTTALFARKLISTVRDVEGTTMRKGHMGAYDDNNKCCLLPSSFVSPFLSRFTHSCAVCALPAVALICRFVCAFKHESPRCGVEHWEAERDGAKSTPAGGKQSGKGVQKSKGRKGKIMAERSREKETVLQWVGKNGSSALVKSHLDLRKVKRERLSSLRTSSPTFNFLPRIQRFLFASLFLSCFATTLRILYLSLFVVALHQIVSTL